MFKKISQFILLISCVIACKNDNTQPIVSKETKININAVENGLLPGMVLKGDIILNYSLKDGMEKHHIPGVSIAVVNDGKIDWAKGYGFANTTTRSKVETTTLFQAASISKPITALAVLKLMEEGKLNLDENVNDYLKNWKVKENQFTATEKVTLRRLLTHSAGITVHGFPGYGRTDQFPSTTEILNGKGNTAIVEVDTIPGSTFQYSGGGYTIIQKVIEDITGLAFEDYMDNNILKPLGMSHSTFAQPLPKNRYNDASAAYNKEGAIIDGYWHNYPEKAAAGLWTTPTDLAKYTIEIQNILAGKQDGILKPETVKLMLSKGKFNHGLGPGVAKEGDSLLFEHGGKNEGFTNTLVAFANKGQSLIIMTNADNGGRLLGDIQRAVSKQYDWGLSKTKIINPIVLTDEYLQNFEGTYKYIEQVPSVGGDYVVKVRVDTKQLVVFDVPENQDYRFVATDSLNFLDIEKNEKAYFKKENNIYVLWWNNSYEFKKVEQ